MLCLRLKIFIIAINSYKLELLSKETMELLGSTKKVLAKDKNGENVPKLEIVV